MLISIISDPVFMVYGMPRHANDLLGEVDVFIGITCQCLVVRENPQVRWSRGNFEIVHHHSYLYFIIKYHNPSSFNCLIDSMFMNTIVPIHFYSTKVVSISSCTNEFPIGRVFGRIHKLWSCMWIWRKEPLRPKKTSKSSLYSYQR